ncbi:MAG: cytochrome d ubiquinol oxidase subunit II [Thermoanaerobaculaceae bacterium]|nr:cytochrome d ubiquinol oxidase subunit II [Thermoanaerobaculaceae bacterium]MDI9621667.1 cytochrome d ubiquinol oxidase subunit II [Acidobacteriota bacterium]NLH09941.1 cytochrome d ubiquinol oxidase subunit II [Holophagae bacterium]HPW54865.1 cytochrome d ubiquinol oxidase subunit II [Thermoanaerobaculaceae bacterium]
MLETIWFAVWGVAWAMYCMLDGFDLGLGTLLPLLARNDTERRVIFNAQGPFWDGNEVWLITAGGVTFAAFPKAYAVMFSGLYLPLLLLLFGLILRGVTFEFRNKVDSPAWRSVWDWCMVVGSFVAALLLGVAFANLFRGLPIDGAGLMRGDFWSLLNPYGLLGGVLLVLLFAVHGSLWLAIKAEGELKLRAAAAARFLWVPMIVTVIGFLISTYASTRLWHNVLAKPYLLVLPLLAVVGLVGVRALVARQSWWWAWGASAVGIAGVVLFGVAGMYPNLLLSSLAEEYSVTAFNAASSPLTLKIMLGVVLVFLPLVLFYQTWVYRLFRDKVTSGMLASDQSY